MDTSTPTADGAARLAAPSPRRRLISALVALALPVTAVVGTTSSSPAGAAPSNPLAFTRGFTLVTFGDAHLNNSELEGSIAVGGDVAFGKGYPIVHTTTLTPGDYAPPVLPVDETTSAPTRLLVGGTFDTAQSFGETNINSRNDLLGPGETQDPAQLGWVRIGDMTGLHINPRGNNGLWINQAPDPAGEQPAIYVPGEVDQPASSVPAPGLFEATFGGAQAAATATAEGLVALGECSNTYVTAFDPPGPGMDASQRVVQLVEGSVNVINIDAGDLAALGAFRITFEGATLGPTTTLVVNITGDPSSVDLPQFTGVTNPSASNPNPVAPYVLWNFGSATGEITVGGTLISGSILAPMATIRTTHSSPLEGQIVSGGLATSGGELHHYAFEGSVTCEDDPEPTTTTEPDPDPTTTTEPEPDPETTTTEPVETDVETTVPGGPDQGEDPDPDPDVDPTPAPVVPDVVADELDRTGMDPTRSAIVALSLIGSGLILALSLRRRPL